MHQGHIADGLPGFLPHELRGFIPTIHSSQDLDELLHVERIRTSHLLHQPMAG